MRCVCPVGVVHSNPPSGRARTCQPPPACLRWWWRTQYPARLVRAGRAAVGVGVHVVEFAVDHRAPAAGEPAVHVPGLDEVGERDGWGVGGAAVVEQCPGGGVEQQPPPGRGGGDLAGHLGGDRAVAEQLAGVVGEPEQRGHRHQDLHQRLARVHRGGQDLVGVAQPATEQVGEQVGAALVHGAGVIGSAAAGEAGEPFEGGDRVRCGEQCPQRRHPVVFGVDRDPPALPRRLVALLCPGRVDGDDRALERGPQLRGGLLRRPGQHPGLDRGRMLGGQVGGGLGDGGDPPLIEQPRLPRRQRGGQPIHQCGGLPGAERGGATGLVQRGGDLLGGPVGQRIRRGPPLGEGSDQPSLPGLRPRGEALEPDDRVHQSGIGERGQGRRSTDRARLPTTRRVRWRRVRASRRAATRRAPRPTRRLRSYVRFYLKVMPVTRQNESRTMAMGPRGVTTRSG